MTMTVPPPEALKLVSLPLLDVKHLRTYFPISKGFFQDDGGAYQGGG